MKPARQKGQLTTWKDERGFGFIKPDEGGREVFLHISALKGAGRRPRVGDTILYEQVAEPNGKIRADRASIQGVAPQFSAPKRESRKSHSPQPGIGIVLLAAMVLLTTQLGRSCSPSSSPPLTQPGCTIKGNISVENGNKVYHLPGMEDYESTVIDPTKGERWFCTESEAIEQGWRRAPR